MKKILVAICALIMTQSAFAVNSVNPNGVNVNTTGTTTVFITFRGTEGQQSSDAFWCGDITVPANTVTTSNPCVPGTIFGHLPKSLDLARNSNNGVNLTDIMTIPPSISRRAMQSARAGNNSSFFYVRKFESNGVTEFIAVTCRMAGGGARVPLALTEVRPYFETERGNVPVHLIAQNEMLPKITANIHYNGGGRLKGRWEIVKPGDVQPEPFDLLPEASLPIEQRGLQKRYTVLESFDVFLPPTGKVQLKGPKASLMPNSIVGPYKLLLRIEATRDKEGNSNTGTGNVASGGVAGFAMPVLRYYVGTSEAVSQARRNAGIEKSIGLISPGSKPLNSNNNIRFNWKNISTAEVYILELQMDNEAFKAARTKATENYELPPWVIENIKSSEHSQWRIVAMDKQGKKIARSEWRNILIKNYHY